jgi:hypothetical protein
MTKWKECVRSREIRFKGEVILRREFAAGVCYQNRNGWMTRSLFELELIRFSKFLEKTKPKQKCLLLVDNFSGHCKIDLQSLGLTNLQLGYFKAGCTGAFQP